MSDFFLGQVMMTGFNFAPKYWAQCNGQLLPIAQNQALFSLLGTHFGGDGINTFALPNLRSRTPTGYGSSVDPSWQPPAAPMGQVGGSENVTLLGANLPAHTHSVNATTASGDNRNATGRLFATSTSTATPIPIYAPSNGALVAQNPQTVAPAGGNQAHPNVQPYTTINFCIALNGIYPSRS